MRTIHIKYNPYKVETEITIDGKPIKKNSSLDAGNQRFQEWVEELPKRLVEECNTKSFAVQFHGTLLDYEDLVSVAEDAEAKGIRIACEHIPAKEAHDKEQAIADIFLEIQHGPFDELKQPDVVKAFEMASSSEFPVNVVATMSAGKSTLINALLRQRLMPARQEACTATITEIKDMDTGREGFQAAVYDRSKALIASEPELTFERMEELNANPQVSTIVAEGDIPFVSSDDIKLVLVDTPGPNNSRDPEHQVTTYRMLSESSKTVVLYVLNATQLGVNDDSNLLSYIADSMSVGGKQSKERFIFVVNKLDDFKKGEDHVAGSLNKVKKYLEDKGIANPNIYPASALTALDIRTQLSDIPVIGLSEDELDELDPEIASAISKVKKMNRNPDLHLENYAPLTPSVRREITAKLEAHAAAMNEQDRMIRSNAMKEEALIHSGIIPIEAAIRMYVAKYAKTAKIKNIVDTFAKKLESARSFENTKQEIAQNRELEQEILGQIEAIRAKLKSGEEAKKFKANVEAINYDKEIRQVANSVLVDAQKKIRLHLDDSKGKKLTRKEAEVIWREFDKFTQDLQAGIEVKLENLVTDHVKRNAEELLHQYERRISELAQDVKSGTVTIKPFEMMSGDVGKAPDPEKLLKDLTKTESVKVGEEWVKNENKKWYKPWTYFQKSGYSKAIYEDQEYINGKELGDKYFAPIEAELQKNNEIAVKYAKDQAHAVKEAFKKRFEELDRVLQRKLDELENCAVNRTNVEQAIRDIQVRLTWLENIQDRIQGILDI
ncbi:hypothetical protein GXP70_02900 [Paenibacillus lycopersici]|uniref:Dynamin N-terminal domain-containing protein n=1 Tax=Paenibacillus lycopersici TaxID=2704462 RepID=A0A6C0FU69_9BACL|nr:dynamin family protein [Paenibacillus lycopersici]QHT59011.1 hypothetical protein GXP70_02900 [Paenibacillus lycopersici]